MPKTHSTDELKCQGRHCRAVPDPGAGMQMVIDGEVIRLCRPCYQKWERATFPASYADAE